VSLHPNQPFLAFPHSIRTHSLTPLSFSLLSISLSFLLCFPQSSLQLAKPFHFQLSRACKPRKFDFPLNSNLYLWLIVCLTPLDSLNLSTRSSIFRISLSFASHSIGELNLDDRQNNLWKRGGGGKDRNREHVLGTPSFLSSNSNPRSWSRSEVLKG